MLQDLVISAVNEALRASQDSRQQKMAGGDRRAEDPGPRLSEATPPVTVRRHRARRAPHRVVLAAARHRAQDRPAPDVLPAARARRGGARARPRADRRPRRGRVLRALLQHQRRAALPDLPRPRPRRRPAVRRRGAAGRARDRPDRRVPRPLPRPPRRDQPDRRHRPGAAQDPRAARPRRRGGRRRRTGSRRSSSPPTRRSRARRPRCTSASASRAGSDSVTRIARGLPVGGDLEYADDVTLIRALQGRRAL